MFFDDDTSGSIPFVDRPAGRQLLARVRDALAAGIVLKCLTNKTVQAFLATHATD